MPGRSPRPGICSLQYRLAELTAAINIPTVHFLAGHNDTRLRTLPPCIIFVMPRIVFTQQLRRFTEVPELELAARHLREALEKAFTANPNLRGYVLDDQGHLRANVVIFIDGRRVRDR